jgi:ChaC-like protein
MMELVEAVHEARARDLLKDDQSDIWIFGFGSLIHNPGFEYADRRTGYIRGWRRVWYQGSTDHRGTVEKPGRTVTLEADATAVTASSFANIKYLLINLNINFAY